MIKQNDVFDVLMYLFENYMDDGSEIPADQKDLRYELTEAGFPKGEINKAFTWLEGLSAEHPALPAMIDGKAIRCYTDAERHKLNVECRGFLLFLEQNGLLGAIARELVIDRLMALDIDEIGLAQLRWIMLMVLFNLPGQDRAYALIEDMVFDETPAHPH